MILAPLMFLAVLARAVDGAQEMDIESDTRWIQSVTVADAKRGDCECRGGVGAAKAIRGLHVISCLNGAHYLFVGDEAGLLRAEEGARMAMYRHTLVREGDAIKGHRVESHYDSDLGKRVASPDFTQEEREALFEKSENAYEVFLKVWKTGRHKLRPALAAICRHLQRNPF